MKTSLRLLLAATLAATLPSMACAQQVVPLVESQGAADAFIPLTPVKKKASDTWLADLRVQLVPSTNRLLPLADVLPMLAGQGLNIVSEVPLAGLLYRAGPLRGVDGESALRQLLIGTGLDYKIDAQLRLVTLRPTAPRTWNLAAADESVWTALRPELEARLAVSLAGGPVHEVLAISTATSSVTVRAPTWVLDDLESYFQRLNALLNAAVGFQAEVISFRGTEVPSLSAFLRDGPTLSSLTGSANSLGGITLRELLQGGREPTALLLDYLNQQGKAEVVLRPLLSAVSGKRASFRQTAPGQGTLSIDLSPRLDPVRDTLRIRLDLTESRSAETHLNGEAMVRSGDVMVLPLATEPAPGGEKQARFLVLRSLPRSF